MRHVTARESMPFNSTYQNKVFNSYNQQLERDLPTSIDAPTSNANITILWKPMNSNDFGWHNDSIMPNFLYNYISSIVHILEIEKKDDQGLYCIYARPVFFWVDYVLAFYARG